MITAIKIIIAVIYQNAKIIILITGFAILISYNIEMKQIKDYLKKKHIFNNYY